MSRDRKDSPSVSPSESSEAWLESHASELVDCARMCCRMLARHCGTRESCFRGGRCPKAPRGARPVQTERASMSTCINHFCIYQVVLTVFIFLIRFVSFLFANLLLTRVFFQARLALSPHPLSQKKHAHKSPLGEVYSHILRGSFRAGEENNGGSTPYCGRDLRNELPEITRCFLGMLAAV